MRPSAVLPALCAIGALVLSLLCLFAGSSRSFMQNADILTLNTSRLGHTSLFNTSDGDGGFLSSLENTIEGDINNLINNATSDIARAFNIHDFYKAHIMDFCEGYYEPDGSVAQDQKHSENITYCSNRTALFHFDPTAIIEHELGNGTNITDLHWPDQITHAVKAVEISSKVMFIFYVVGIALSGIAVITALVGVLLSGRFSAFINWVVDFLAFLCLGIASAISTAIAVKVTHEINKYGSDIGIAAYRGNLFLGMTWGSVAAMLLASLFWVVDCCVGRRHHRSTAYHEKTTRY